MFFGIIINEIIIPLIEEAINGIIKMVQTKTFWIILLLLIAGVTTIKIITDLSFREILSVDQITNLWGLTDSADGHDTANNPNGKYRGGATPYDR